MIINKSSKMGQLRECEKLWSKYSCDCLGFEITSLEKQKYENSKTTK